MIPTVTGLIEAPARTGYMVASRRLCRGAYGFYNFFFFHGWASDDPTMTESAEAPAVMRWSGGVSVPVRVWPAPTAVCSDTRRPGAEELSRDRV